MGIVDKKRKIFGNIAAARTLTENMPKLKLNYSFPSINNKKQTITFLTDLIKSLIGFSALIKSVVDFLTNSLDKIETEIKTTLKFEIKSIVSCGIDPSIPAFLKSTGSGIIIEVKKIDFFDIFKEDPTSIGGKLLYNDVTSPLSNSSDFNTFLYNAIQNPGIAQTWKGILTITFNDILAGQPNNTFTIKATTAYNSKKLTDLNNDFIDTLSLFKFPTIASPTTPTLNPNVIINKIIDIIYGTVSSYLNKTLKQLEREDKVNKIVEKIINADNGDDLSDSYFTFDNNEIAEIERNAEDRQKGIKRLNTEEEINTSIQQSTLVNLNNNINTASTTQQKKDVLYDGLNTMADENTVNLTNPVDKVSVKLDFIQNIIDALTKSIVNVVLSPKVIMLYLINYKIVYGPAATYDDPSDFIKQNKNLIKKIVKKITGEITKVLIQIALIEIAKLVAKQQEKKQIEKNKNKIAQILSLLGTSQEAIRVIKGLTK